MSDALSLAFAYLNRRERTLGEVRRRLEKADVPAAEVDAALAELCELGYLDDARYARLFVEDKRSLEAWGRERIGRVLAERGIDRAVIARALDAEPAMTERDRALDLLRRRFPAPPADPRDRQRALGLLVRKGYDSDLAYEAVRAYAGGSSRSEDE